MTADQPELSSLKIKLGTYFIATRPWSFTASGTSVFLGAVLAYKTEKVFDFSLFVLTLISVFSTHAAGNLVNTLYDYINSIDTKSSAADKTLVDGILDQQEINLLIHFCYQLAVFSFAMICAAGFQHVVLVQCLPLFLIGILASFVYTGSIGLKYIALGDVVIFTAFGPVVTLYSYCLQAGHMWMYCVLYATPLSLLCEAILHGNNIRDLKADKKCGVVTIAILLGQSAAPILYSALLIAPYVITSVMAWFQSYWLLLPLLSSPIAINLNNECWSGNGKSCHGNGEHNHSNATCHGDLTELPEKTAFLNLVFSVLYVFSLVIM